jgi:hypothetical protein
MVQARHSLLAIVLLTAACSTQTPPPQRAANPNRYIYVTSENLAEQCYRDLGPINLTEPFAQATVESGDTTMENRLRALALKQYPNNADAVINVDAANNDAGTATTVSGEVVEVQDHTTAACVLRDAPPVIDGAAQSAVGGMLGTLAGGLITGSPQAAEGGGMLGATAAGSIAVIQHHQAVQQRAQDTRETLAEQQQTIVSLQKARAQLTECKEEETPLSQCGNVQSASDKTAPPDTSDEPDWSASQFDLEKQVEIQQDYIAKLQAQIGDIKHDMSSQ